MTLEDGQRASLLLENGQAAALVVQGRPVPLGWAAAPAATAWAPQPALREPGCVQGPAYACRTIQWQQSCSAAFCCSDPMRFLCVLSLLVFEGSNVISKALLQRRFKESYQR